ncbi:Uma2 family endonuclease [Geodermatophilus bullaregiensis]|uniref:Uma2 family endonuclease n=1 Tax=Geodermatophilus bullaregiensis TaxID=1564160 RepID=UPI001958B629|nr:Uma2 family endonuclease [Geodermatophilus bullaregiensis]MBM7805531.1 Uma2 family endonuclease [Geodermatophilus bullaregiensis]
MSAQPAAAVAPMTAEQLMDLPDDGRRRELVDGELREKAPAGFRHGRVAARTARRLDESVESHELGAVAGAGTGFRLTRQPDTVRAPDVSFIAAHRLPSDEDELDGLLELAPDLVVEVVSPSDRATEVTEKALAWLTAGVVLVWVVYPRQRLVAVYAPGGAVTHVGEREELDGGDVLPGLRLPVADLFGQV